MNSIHSLHQHGFQSSLRSSSHQNDARSSSSVPTTPVPVTDKETRSIAAVVRGQEAHGSRPQSQNTRQQTKEAVISDSSNEGSEKQIQLLDATERKQVQELSQRDREVKAHESAHLAAAGQHATSGARYTYARGPDGRSYAVGGSVGIDTGAEADPEATLRKADQIKRAALAPAEPSGQDRSVAAAATSLRQQAQAEIVKEQALERSENVNKEGGDETEDGIIGNETGLNSDGDNKQKPAGSASGLETDSDNSDRGEHDHSDSTPSTCEVCGGSHGSEGHVAANKVKLENSYQVNSDPQNGPNQNSVLNLFA